MDKISVLIYGTNKKILTDLKKQLKNIGFNQVAINSGGKQDFIQKIIEIKPNIIVCYTNMEKQIITAIDHAYNLLQIPSVIITSKPDDYLKLKTTQIFSLMSYPLNNAVLHANIKIAINKHKQKTILEKSYKWIRTTLLSIGDGVIATDSKGKITFMNEIAEQLTEYSYDESKNSHISQIFKAIYEDTNKNIFIDKLNDFFDKNQNIDKQSIILETKNNKQIPIEQNITAIKNDKNGILGVVIIFRDITKSKEMEQQLHSMAMSDELSGLYNRVGFFNLANSQLKYTKRNNKNALIIYIDLNKMKLINDTYGHKEGDIVIKKTATILQKTFRESDTIARIGGDEFIVVATVETDDTNADEIILKRLNRQLINYNSKSDKPYKLDMSVGFACYNPTMDKNLDELISEADKNMYKNKSKANQECF